MFELTTLIVNMCVCVSEYADARDQIKSILSIDQYTSHIEYIA